MPSSRWCRPPKLCARRSAGRYGALRGGANAGRSRASRGAQDGELRHARTAAMGAGRAGSERALTPPPDKAAANAAAKANGMSKLPFG
jgi:hypothetical protein